jgi:hypothetical protein
MRLMGSFLQLFFAKGPKEKKRDKIDGKKGRIKEMSVRKRRKVWLFNDSFSSVHVSH